MIWCTTICPYLSYFSLFRHFPRFCAHLFQMKHQRFRKNIPEIKVCVPEGTYLLWLDCRELGLSGDELQTFMVQDAGLALNDGRGFGPEGGGYMRMNIACPRATIERALGQLKAAVDRKMGR